MAAKATCGLWKGSCFVKYARFRTLRNWYVFIRDIPKCGFRLAWFRFKWHCANPHNLTTPEFWFPADRVRVGRGVYGNLRVHNWPEMTQRLSIGDFVSIAGGVDFMLIGDHRTSGVSSFPFRAVLEGRGDPRANVPRGDIAIGDDVWIGLDARIMAGVRVGQGAVIAANAVVTKDVEPYAVVGGIPARVLKYRFPEDVRGKLARIRFDRIPDERVGDLAAINDTDVTSGNVGEIVERIEALYAPDA